MLFLSVGQELREEIKCDFVLLEDTEGLIIGHGNQLATGFKDVTVINIALENSVKIKDVLDMSVHALLRMSYLGNFSLLNLSHEIVSGVSAHSKIMTDRKHL